MNLLWIGAVAVTLLATLAYLGLCIYGFRTPNGFAWRVFCAMAVADCIRSGLWTFRVASYRSLYETPPLDVVLILAAQFVGAVLTGVLAFALKRAPQEEAKGRPSTGPEGNLP